MEEEIEPVSEPVENLHVPEVDENFDPFNDDDDEFDPFAEKKLDMNFLK